MVDLIDRVEKNLGSSVSSQVLRQSIKEDIYDTYVKVKRLSEHPIKQQVFSLSKHVNYDFSIANSGAWADNISEVKYYENNVLKTKVYGTTDESISGVLFNASAGDLGLKVETVHGLKSFKFSIGSDANFTINELSVLKPDNTKDILLSSVSVTPASSYFVSTDYYEVSIEDLSYNNEVTVYLEIAEIALASNVFVIKKIDLVPNSAWIRLPDDFIAPRGITFWGTSKQEYYNNEVYRERFNRWQPPTNAVIETVDSQSPAAQKYSSEENIDYDYSIGYYFDYRATETILVYKPVVDGEVMVAYSYLPNDFTQLETNDISLQKIFYELLNHGATLRGLVRKYNDAENEIDVISLDRQIRLYTKYYEKDLVDYTGYSKKDVEIDGIKPFSFTDFSMERN